MKRLLMGMVLLAAVSANAWAVCPEAPRRPVCIPEVGSFADAREAERCEEEMQAYAAKTAKAYRCENNHQRKLALRKQARQVRQDFEDAADGLLASTLGQPGSPPGVPGVGGVDRNGLNVDVNGQAGNNGGGGLPPGIFADGTNFGIPVTDTPVPTQPATPGRGW